MHTLCFYSWEKGQGKKVLGAAFSSPEGVSVLHCVHLTLMPCLGCRPHPRAWQCGLGIWGSFVLLEVSKNTKQRRQKSKAVKCSLKRCLPSLSLTPSPLTEAQAESFLQLHATGSAIFGELSLPGACRELIITGSPSPWRVAGTRWGRKPGWC